MFLLTLVEGIATALPHDERSRDKLTLADAMSALQGQSGKHLLVIPL